MQSLVGNKITKIIIRQPNLREIIPVKKIKELVGFNILGISRRGKYILVHTKIGTLIIHLGMSGRLLVLSSGAPLVKHDHVDIFLNNEKIMRYNDPRRFGNIQFSKDNADEHKLLSNLGPEPLGEYFNEPYLFEITRNKKRMIKDLLMDNKKVVGIGNIYASEILFAAGINPLREAGSLASSECACIIKNTRKILREAIKLGGTSIRDYKNAEGEEGLYSTKLKVYGRKGEFCYGCKKTIIQKEMLHGRSVYFCKNCQK